MTDAGGLFKQQDIKELICVSYYRSKKFCRLFNDSKESRPNNNLLSKHRERDVSFIYYLLLVMPQLNIRDYTGIFQIIAIG